MDTWELSDAQGYLLTGKKLKHTQLMSEQRSGKYRVGSCEFQRRSNATINKIKTDAKSGQLRFRGKLDGTSEFRDIPAEFFSQRFVVNLAAGTITRQTTIVAVNEKWIEVHVYRHTLSNSLCIWKRLGWKVHSPLLKIGEKHLDPKF